jgi:hypothetical protein
VEIAEALAAKSGRIADGPVWLEIGAGGNGHITSKNSYQLPVVGGQPKQRAIKLGSVPEWIVARVGRPVNLRKYPSGGNFGNYRREWIVVSGEWREDSGRRHLARG